VNNKIAGAGQLVVTNGAAGCYSGAVLPEFRRQGVATALLFRRFCDGFAAGARIAYTFTYSVDSPILKACTKMGYPQAFVFENWR
jgi:GNAT superfamily N-acetyltransferase